MHQQGCRTLWALLLAVALQIPGGQAQIDVCPDARWTDAVFLRSTVNESYFTNISAWTSEDYKTWVVDDLKSDWIPSAVFLGLALLSLLSFIVWRLFHCCFAAPGCCCGASKTRQKPITTVAYATGTTQAPPVTPASRDAEKGYPGAWGNRKSCLRSLNWLTFFLRVIVTLLGMAAAALIIWGIVEARRELATEAWNELDYGNNYVKTIADKIELVTSNATALENSIDRLQTVVDDPNSGLTSAPPSVQQDVKEAMARLQEAKATIQANIAEFQNGVATIRDQVTSKVDDLRRNYYDDTQEVEQYTYRGFLIISAVGLLFLALLAVALTVNCPALLTTCLLFLQLIAVLYFVFPLVFAFVVAGGNDICPATTTVIVSFTGEQLAPLAEFYLNRPQNGDLPSVLKSSGIVDLPLLEAQVNQIRAGIANVASQVPPSSQVYTALVATDSAAQDTAQSKDVVLGTASYRNVQAVYSQVKGSLCCSIPEDLVYMWYASTLAAWFLMVMSWVAYGLISQYDRALSSSTPWGWTVIRPASAAPHPPPAAYQPAHVARDSAFGENGSQVLNGGNSSSDVQKPYALPPAYPTVRAAY